MVTAFFLRHGPTQENIEGRIQGQRPGTILVPETQRYVAAVAEILNVRRFDLLMSSDLERAVQTLHFLKDALGDSAVKETFSALLREKAMGLYEGMLWSEVPPEFQEQRGNSAFNFHSFGGENATDVHERVRQFLRELAQRYPSQRVAIVTHAGWLAQLAKLADTAGVLPDQWDDRSAVYEAGIGPLGQLQYFYPHTITLDVTLDADE